MSSNKKIDKDGYIERESKANRSTEEKKVSSSTTNRWEEKKMSKKITPRDKDYSKWYLDVIATADLSDSSPVRGCMVIKPYGYALWENIQKVLDGMFKETGVVNAYFPLFIPKSLLEKEAKHAEGFAKEVAIVTHHRLKMGENGKLIPASELEEPLIVRPTSETIIYDAYSKWVQSYRDLPLLINQWANVVRWELRTKPFLRTMEFLWQEGHTAHATKEEADEETMQMLEVYRRFVEEYLAIPVISGRKTESEKFAGAVYTTCIEAMMQDTKALQSGTSHMLGQNFAKGFDVKFLDQNGDSQYVWQTSWGLSTRIIGGLIMVHSDDKGLVVPPKIAPVHSVIIPIWGGDETEKVKVLKKSQQVADSLKSVGLSVKIDAREGRPGFKFFEWERKGIPVRIEIGPKDLANDSVVVVRRDTSEKRSVAFEGVVAEVQKLLDEIHENLFNRALKFQKDNTHQADSWINFTKYIPEVKREPKDMSRGEENEDYLEDKNRGGFLLAHHCGDADCEAKIKELTRATIRCIPFDQMEEEGKCVLCGEKSCKRVIFAKAY